MDGCVVPSLLKDGGAMAEIRLENVSKIYPLEGRGKNKRKHYAVRDIDLTVYQGEFVFLIGSSGAGKSTLLKLISGEIRADKGLVLLNGVNVGRFFGPWRSHLSKTFGIVSQQSLLIRKRTIQENLLLAARAGGLRREAEETVEKALGIVGLKGAGSHYPVELSLGECRRAELARALVISPSILLVDELTANLDDDNIWDMMQLLNDLNARGTTVIMATHASQYVNIMRRRVVTLSDGRLVGDVRNGKYGDIV